MSDVDPDGDSQMEHSSSDAEDAESMFPTANDPVTTNSQFDSILNTASGPVSDLSPPASQDPPGRNGALAQDGEAMDIGNGERGRKGNLKSEFAKTAASTHEPGASWNNRKAKDEWQRAWNSLEDKTFSLKEFGDPFDERQTDRGNVRERMRM